MEVESPGPPGPTAPPEILYNDTNPGPYIVFVQPHADQTSPSRIHPITFGKFLASNKIGGIKNITIKGRNRLGVSFNTSECANQFVKNKNVSTGFNVFIPKHLTTIQGIIRQVDQSLTTEEIKENIKSSVNVLSVRRLNRRTTVPVQETLETGEQVTKQSVQYVPTQTVVVTFAGRFLPKSVSLFYVSMEVQVYVLPVLRCYQCLRFGHTAKLCKSKVRCPICSEEHVKAACIEKIATCIHCESSHSSLDPTCPELKRQQRIKELMATERLTFVEASKLIPKFHSVTQNRNYTSTLVTPQHFPTINPVVEQFPMSAQTVSPNFKSYAHTTAGKKRKQTATTPPGYDHAAHNSQLLSPNGHLPSSPTSPSTNSESYLVNINQTDITTLQTLLTTVPQGETILNLIYSILHQAVASSANQNNVQNTTVELSRRLQ